MSWAKYKLTNGSLKTKRPGLHPDGGGLYLQVTIGKDGQPRRSWLCRYRLPSGKTREMGLGSVDRVTLAEARAAADEARSSAAKGEDPLAQRERAAEEERLAALRAQTFRQCVDGYITLHRATWRSPKHAKQWDAALSKYAYPVFGDVPVSEVDRMLVMQALMPIWNEKPETARRVRQRVEAVLDFAAAQGLRSEENPARLNAVLKKALPARGDAQRVQHRPAMAWIDVPAFMERLSDGRSMGSLAFAFCIFTAARTSEVLLATWDEFDLASATWTIPAGRMKMSRSHRVPLSSQALQVIAAAKAEVYSPPYVFPGARQGRPLSNMVFLTTLKRMGVSSVTPHGFRSTFRDWAAECTDHPGEVAEACLAHAIGDKVEAAYRRTDLFDRRRLLMQQWADFLGPSGAPLSVAV
jgi:integrase